MLAAVAGGDAVAFARLYERHAGALRAFALRLLGQRELAGDIVQETFTRVWQDAGAYQGRGRAEAWIFRITANLCLDERRRQRAQHRLARRYQQVQVQSRAVTGNATVPEEVWTHYRQTQVGELLGELPVCQRRVLELIHYHSLTVREIAVYLQIPEGTVKTRSRLSLVRLRAVLAARGVTVEDMHW